MGIDVYLQWEGQTPAERKAQITGFDTTAGAVGYLREAYHGGPYATKILVAETFGDSNTVAIPAATLRERLPATLDAVRERCRKVYKEEAPKALLKSFEDFVALAERKEAELGKPCVVMNSY